MRTPRRWQAWWALTVAFATLTSNTHSANARERGQQEYFSHSMLSDRPRKVAIVGAGPSGTSAAYWLSKAQEQLDLTGQGHHGFHIHIYEKETRIGGRAKIVHPYGDEKRYQAVELGASIFADVNRNMVRLAKTLRLPTNAKLSEDGSIAGIWDGSQFVIEDLGDSWWSSAKLFWRYGYSPATTRSLVKDMVASFLQLYSPQFLHEKRPSNVTEDGFPWSSVEDIAKALEFDDAAATDAHTWFYSKGVSQLFVEELVEAATRVNYGQNTDEIHALGAGVSLAASGAKGVQGGNNRIFQELAAKSGARLYLAEHGEVTGIVRLQNVAQAVERNLISKVQAAGLTHEFDQPKWWVGTSAGTGSLYDAVFVGAPWHTAGITLMGTEAVIPVKKYVHLHVTLIATNASHPKAQYFGRTEGSDVPTTILTTYEAERKKARGSIASKDTSIGRLLHSWWPGRLSRPHTLAKELRLNFNSLNYIAKLPKRAKGSDDEHLVKIFSREQLCDQLLDELFGLNRIGWIHREEWDAYPELHPTRDFPAIQPDTGLFYINAFETLVSTMETSTVASRNAVALLLMRWYGSDFVHGRNCKFAGEQKDGDDDGDFRDGWDGWGCVSG